MNRRAFLRTAVGALAAAPAAGRPPTHACGEQEGPPPGTPAQAPVQFVRCGDLSVLFGDGTPHGMGGPGYCGIWSLGSVHDSHNGFVNSLAGFLFNSHRKQPVGLRRTGQHQVLYRFRGKALYTQSLFTVREPHYVDCTTTVVPQRRVAGPYLQQSWASYINSPLSGDIHFLHERKWVRAHSPAHGVDATYAPSSLTDPEDDLRHLSPEERKSSFVHAYSQQRFDEPFYYGRVRRMAMAFFFDTYENIRFTISPTGGGVSILPDKTSPAWDWLWLIPHPKVGKGYSLRVRMIYRYFVSREDIVEEFNRWRSTLGRPRQAGT